MYLKIKTRSGPKIPAAGLFGGRLHFGFGLLDAFFANQNSLTEDEVTIQIFFAQIFLRLVQPPNSL